HFFSTTNMLTFSASPGLPQTGKRPHSNGPPKPRPRVSGPFVDDEDDSDDDDNQDGANEESDQPTLPGPEPLPKRRMVHDLRGETQANPQTESGLDEAAAEAVGFEANGDAIQGPAPGNDIQKPAPVWSTQRPLFSASLMGTLTPSSYSIVTSDGKISTIKERKAAAAVSYEAMVASRSKTKEGRAKKSYYGIDIHQLIDGAAKEMAASRDTAATEPEKDTTTSRNVPLESAENSGKKPKKSLLWTEKYRARNFMDLCGDDGTNRMVLRWLKRWDPIVFPGTAKSKSAMMKRLGQSRQTEEEKPHRKILMLTGPPGLGKTTLAHVCAKQAGYEVLEVNASDDRSRDVVKNRIRTSLGTETVKTVSKGSSKPIKPVCVVVDEVDGAVTGSSASGEGGFVKALIDLVQLDEKNSSPPAGGGGGSSYGKKQKKKGDDFRLMRPLILICNDVYHPSLRPLRHSGLAEVIHVGRPSIDAVVGRLKAVFDKEAIPCDKDAARKLCEAAWGVSGGMQNKRRAESTVEGDLRGVMVVGEWVAGRFRSSVAGSSSTERLTRQWIEQNVMHDLTSGAAGARGLGRGSVRDIVGRLFQLGGGFPQQQQVAVDVSKKTMHEQPKAELGFGEQQKKYAMERLREMADTSGEISYILTEVFAEYPQREFNDDSYLTKPNQAYDWLHFHDACQSRLYASQDWELAPYLSQPVLACHHLFASPHRHQPQHQQKQYQQGQNEAETEAPKPFTGPRADAEAREAERHNRAQLQTLQAQLSPTLTRSFRSAEDVATEFLPYLRRIVSPDVRPVVVGGSEGGSTASVRKESEKRMVARAAEVLAEVGVSLHRGKIEADVNARSAQYVYRMEPDLDALGTFETAATLVSSHAPIRYAVRQVLDQELQRALARREAHARQARFRAGRDDNGDDDEQQTQAPSALALYAATRAAQKRATTTHTAAKIVKKDFFGRVIEARDLAELDTKAQERAKIEERKVWVTYHEGMNNAVRKPLPLQDFLRGL
ncbi:chromosome transmission fidelity protein 18, partial [Geosmithia morbida]